MSRFGLSLAILLCCFGGAPALGGPGGEALHQVLAKATETGEIELTQQIQSMVFEARQREITVYEERIETVEEVADGKAVQKTVTRKVPVTRTETYTVAKPVYHEATRLLRLDTTRFFEVNGQPVPADAAVRRLREPTLVVVTYDGKPLADYYAWIFKPGTLVVSLMPQAPQGYGAPVEPPQGDGQPVPQPVEAPRPAAPQPVAPVPSATNHTIRGVVAPVSQETQPVQPETLLPETAAPAFLFASLAPKGTLRFRILNEFRSSNTVQAEQTGSDGKPQMANVQIQVEQLNNTIVTLPLQFASVNRINSRPISADELSRVLSREQAAVVSPDGKAIDPFWLQNIRGTVFVVVPPFGTLQYGQGASCQPIPAPMPAAPQAVPVPNAPSPPSL